jgi:hypothetical protein
VPTVYVVIGCDADPDRKDFLDRVPHDTLTWRGLTEGVPLLKSSLQGVRDATGREPVFTWLLRADEQIRDVHGEYAAIARRYQPLLQTLQQSGDELGWHPHFWRRDGARGSWFQEVEDVDWQVDMLRKAHADLATCLPDGVKSVRMGWDYHNNRTYRALEELGIVVDFSAIPGMRTFIGTPPTKGENLFDWHSSPRTPYRPSREDYRRPAEGRANQSRLLEVPNFVSTSAGWSLVSGLQLARKTGNAHLLWQSIRRPTYWINITARPRFFAPLVKQLRKTLSRRDSSQLVFATYFHPDELLPNRSGLYDLESVRENIEAVLGTCDAAGSRVEFVQASRIPALWSAAA